METIGAMTLEDAATHAAGNWKRFSCFCWDRLQEIDDPDNWAIAYTHNRDSGLLAQSNAAAIAERLRPYSQAEDPDVVFESHSHWAVGHVDGFSIRVYRNGEITESFHTYHELSERMAEYSILDEIDYSEREHEATIENLTDAAWRLKSQYELRDGWESEVHSWLDDNRPGSIENRDDQGGYPSEGDLREAFDALHYERVEE